MDKIFGTVSRAKFPFRRHAVLLFVDYEETDCIWTLWIETGIRRHGIRLSRTMHGSREAVTIALVSASDALIAEMMALEQDPKHLAHKLVAAASAGLTHTPSAACIGYLRWRLCEEIHRLRRAPSSMAVHVS